MKELHYFALSLSNFGPLKTKSINITNYCLGFMCNHFRWATWCLIFAFHSITNMKIEISFSMAQNLRVARPWCSISNIILFLLWIIHGNFGIIGKLRLEANMWNICLVETILLARYGSRQSSPRVAKKWLFWKCTKNDLIDNFVLAVREGSLRIAIDFLGRSLHRGDITAWRRRNFDFRLLVLCE